MPSDSITPFIFAHKLRKLQLVAMVGLLLASCDQKAFLEKFVPKDDDAFARRFLDAVRAGDYAVADQMLDASLRGEKSTSGLHDLNRVLTHGEPVSVEVIGFGFITNETPTLFNNANLVVDLGARVVTGVSRVTGAGGEIKLTATDYALFGLFVRHPGRVLTHRYILREGTARTTNLSYQIHFQDSWAAGDVSVGHPSGLPTVLGWQFQPVPDSLEVLNRFTFAGKSLVHYLVFAACIAVPAFILIALIVCISSGIRRKWLWIIFILLGLVQFQFDWASGHFDVQPISFLLFGASAVRVGYAPWMLSFAIPVGAIIFLLLRPGLLRGLAAIFLALVILGALGIGFVAMRSSELNKESKAYADAAIPLIVTTWLDKALLDRASPEFNQTTTAVQVYAMFRWWESSLGRLQKYEPAQGQSEFVVTPPSDKTIAAQYTSNAQFEKGEATIRLVLIKHGDQWQIVSLDVDSQLLLSRSAMDKESKAYADAAIPAIVTKWNRKELLDRASPEFKQAMTTDQLDRLFQEARSLGRLRKCDPAQGQSEFVVTPPSDKTIAAQYTSNAQFEKGEATIRLVLVKHGDQWQIAGFWLSGTRQPK